MSSSAREVVEMCVLIAGGAWAALAGSALGPDTGDDASAGARALVLGRAACAPHRAAFLFQIAGIVWIRGRGGLPREWLDASRTNPDPGILYVTLVSMVLVALYENFCQIGHGDPYSEHGKFLLFALWTSHALATRFGLIAIGLKSIILDVALAALAALVSTAASANLGVSLHAFAYAGVALGFQRLLFKYWVQAFNKSFTIGEAVIVANGLALVAASALLSPPDKELGNALQGGLLGVLSLASILGPFFRKNAVLENETADVNPRVGPSPKTLARRRTDSQIIKLLDWSSLPLREAAVFYVQIVVWLGFVAYAVARRLGGKNPVMWVADFTFSDATHLQLLAYWVACLAVGLPLIHFVAAGTSWPLIITRKLYHLLALALFGPAMVISPDFMGLSFGIATALLLLIEYVRICRVPPLGRWIHFYLRSYTDSRDEGTTILTHIYLLVGCALPLWVFGRGDLDLDDATKSSSTFSDPAADNARLAAYGGLVILGAGDAAGAIIGSTFGQMFWPGSRKTLEGTLAAMASSLVTIVALAFGGFYWSSAFAEGSTQVLFGVIVATFLTCILEAFTRQIDNLTLPVFFAALLATIPH